MKFSRTYIVKSLAALALATAGSGAFSASTWGFGSGCGAADGTFNNASLSCAVTSGTAAGAVTVTAFAVDNASAAATFAGASVGYYNPNGFGVTYTGELTSNPQHTTDNNGRTELLLLNFGAYSVDLDAVSIGYKSDSAGNQSTTADADISVFRYIGSSSSPTVAGLTANGLTGWQLVGNYADLSTTTAKSVNSTSLTSSWWLISAYNATYGVASGADQGAANSGGTTGLQNNNDYFKVFSVAGTATKSSKIPEPGSLALLGLGLVGLVASRRRKSVAI